MVYPGEKEPEEDLLTIGQLADALGVTTHRVKYAIEQYHIREVMRIGIIRVWRKDDIGRIRNALRRIASHRPRN